MQYTRISLFLYIILLISIIIAIIAIPFFVPLFWWQWVLLFLAFIVIDAGIVSVINKIKEIEMLLLDAEKLDGIKYVRKSSSNSEL